MNGAVPQDVLIALAAGGLLLALLFGIALLRARSARGQWDGVGNRLARLDELAARLTRFEQALTVPRERGALGERLLADLLASWLPRASYDTQFNLPGGVRVDAVVKLGDRLLPIDAKFPLEAVQTSVAGGQGLDSAARRAIERHIRAVAERYVQPAAGTHNFALLYVPSDALYLRCFAETRPDLLAAAMRQRVVPVGPSGLYLYLHTVGHALSGLRIAEHAQLLADTVQRARDELAALHSETQLISTHLRHLEKAHENAHTHLRKLDLTLDQLERW